VGFKKSCAFEGKKKGLRELTPVTSVFFFPGKFSQIRKEEKKKGKRYSKGFC